MSVKLSIGARLVLSISALIAVIVISLTLIAARNILNKSESDAKELSRETASVYAWQIKAQLDNVFSKVTPLANILEGSVQGEQGYSFDRYTVLYMLRDVLVKNPELLSVYTGFESNAFDGKDDQFRNTIGHDGTGRFVPLLARDGKGGILFEAMTGYEDGTENYYSITRRLNRPVVIEPYEYDFGGQRLRITSLILPVKDASGRFLGIAGADIVLDSVQKFVDSIDIPGIQGEYMRIVADSGMVVASAIRTEIGKPVSTVMGETTAKALLSGRPQGGVRHSTLLNAPVVYASIPVEIGSSGQKWVVEVNIPDRELRAGAFSLVTLLLGIGFFGVIFAVFVVLLITRTIVLPIRQAVTRAEEVAAGDLSRDLAVEYRNRNDEIGVLSRALQNMIEKLRGIIGEVSVTAQQVSTGSQQLSDTSQQIAQGASEQASSVEQISASMEQMSANIRQNAENALQTEQISRKSAQSAEAGGKAVAETVVAMKQIASKISIIEEIARSTNMLSLNASIEAARAGEFGKGFAVVAAEVGKLAERSHKEASEISELSAKSVGIAEDAGSTITALVPEIKRTADLVQEISAATAEQNSGAEQITAAIMQLDLVVQQNASASEESASMAEELSAQAEQMKTAMSYFRAGSGHKSAVKKTEIAASGSLIKKPDVKPPEEVPAVNATSAEKKMAKSSASSGTKPPDNTSVAVAPGKNKTAKTEKNAVAESVKPAAANVVSEVDSKSKDSVEAVPTVSKATVPKATAVKPAAQKTPVTKETATKPSVKDERKPVSGIHLILDEDVRPKGRDEIDNDFQEF